MAAVKGPLQTKLKRRAVPLLVSESKQMEVRDGWLLEEHEKLLLLCDEMSIAPGPHQFYSLAMALAKKHHFAFQEETPLGKWTDIAGIYLVVEIERLTDDGKPGHSELWAAYQLLKRPEWNEFLGGREDPGEALRRQYQKFKKTAWASVGRDAFKFHKEQGTVNEWEARLKDVLRDPHGLSRSRK